MTRIDPFYAIPHLDITHDAPLSQYTRFGLGGAADLLVETTHPGSFQRAIWVARGTKEPYAVLGGGSNLVVADQGYRGIVLRYRGKRIERRGELLWAESGAVLQALVDFSIDQGLEGLHTMTRIPGWVGGAVYGNAGAYGHSTMEFVERVEIFDGDAVRWLTNADCRFSYRESVFKKQKEWIVLSVELRLPPGDPVALRAKADEIQRIRDAKYPPTMRCAGSIFKNCILAELAPAVRAQVPPKVPIEGKVPSAWFLEQVGAKGMRRGDIQVAAYHANLIYNDGAGKASDVRALVDELKRKVQARFGLALEEEVQYVGFLDRGA